ncbi:hypothetical protein J31TS4_06660 [Paenibacillus sp. J31TS4]|uniref:TraR/DksA C4-type zinc finger protein n=1 Tax=Paenibacillus sp. J31TS4 TaxID=2807195 RepID=UPI001B0E6A47|nr:TraR/DksA C4-type zinc finger protein [Paenibacillus sp. J31TS4]GIP37386.1 hypothetical protein J31TS4_06660 [Paenibacillus sp. J31TS4]
MSLTEQQIDELKKELLEEKEDLEARLGQGEGVDEDESLRESVGELSAVDNHPGDLGTELFERSRDLALHDTDEEHLEEINRALESMENGQYGRCITCGREIPFERLQALPFTEYCVEHTPNRSVPDDRPVEEDVMSPNSGQLHRGLNDERNESLGENAWDRVEDYGNSDSPAMSENRDMASYDDGMLIEDDADKGYTVDKTLANPSEKPDETDPDR